MLLVGLAWYWWIPIVAVPLVFALPIVLTVAAALFEKRVVWYFEPAQVAVPQAASPVFDPMNPYAVSGQAQAADVPPPDVQAAAAIASARQHGFQSLGVFRDAKGALYRVRYEFWLSPDRDVLALIGCGKVASMQVSATWLYTRLADGRIVLTLDAQSASEYDLSGQRIEALIPAQTFDRLLATHLMRVSKQSAGVTRYGADPLADHRADLMRRATTLVDRGYAQFLDAQQTTWTYTLRGAIPLAFLANGQALRRSILPDSVLGR